MSSGFTVVGSGPGGLALAGHLRHRGFGATVCEPRPERLQVLRDRASIRLRGEITTDLPIDVITDDPEAALADPELVFVVVPAHYHAEIAGFLAAHIRPDHTVVLLPGRLFGAWAFARELARHGAPPCLVADATTIPHTCRRTDDEGIMLFAVKRRVDVACLDAGATPDLVRRMNDALPVFQPAVDVLETGLNSVGAILHPLPTLLNVGWIETARTRFLHYYEGITPTVARVLEQMDGERLAVGRRLGVSVNSVRSWLHTTYGAEGSDLEAALRNTACYREVDAPVTLEHRYLEEDVPTGLVPIASLARALGLHTPVTNLAIDLAELLCATDFRARGRTLENLGLEDLSPSALREAVIAPPLGRAP